jgi:hypothetical protein
MIKPLDYYFTNGSYVKFHTYTIDTFGVIRNTKTGETMSLQKNKAGYNMCTIKYDTGKRRGIQIGRAIASTFHGKPQTLAHTADHIDRDKNNDTLDNVRWATKSEQSNNRVIPTTYKIAFLVDKEGEEKTVDEWIYCLKDKVNHMGREYTWSMIVSYAQKKQHGFSYKEYPDLPGEVWKVIIGSENKKGRWEISNMNRVKYITKYSENVLSGERLGLVCGYPTIGINGKRWGCHILAFMSFFPEEYAAKKPEEIILHKNDDKLDFRPHMLRIGTQSENMIDAHNNGCRDGTKSARVKCVSYINGEFEKEHESQSDAVRYLKSIGFSRASARGISRSLRGVQKTAYDRTWKLA